MKYILCNISMIGDSIDEQNMDAALKEIPYNSKIKYEKLKYDNGKYKYQYAYIMLPEMENNVNPMYTAILDTAAGKTLSTTEQGTIYPILSKYLDRNKIPKLQIELIDTLTDADIGISYTDGSSSKAKNEAAYACCVLKKRKNKKDDPMLYESFTQKEYAYNAYAGKAICKDGTNNVGELTAFGEAAAHFGKNQYQIIVSDSEYSIKAFREWYYSWSHNNFRSYSGKEIKNKELIQRIHSNIFSSGKITLFKWTAGHAGEPFNEKCDELAKHVLGLTK